MNAVRIRRTALPAHPWVYRKQVTRPDPGTRNGDPVRILGRDGQPLGAGLYHGKSQIAIRVLTTNPNEAIDTAFIRRRVGEAIRFRRETLQLDRRTNACRLVNAEGDGLSGIIVDRYANRASIRLRCLGMYRFAADVVAAIDEAYPGIRALYRRDPEAERIEGFRVPEPTGYTKVDIEVDRLKYRVDLVAGHKTGAFLDQRDNHRFAASMAKGRSVLDLFTCDGGFALSCARAGAKRTIASDLDENAVARAKGNAKANRLDVECRHADAFDVLKSRPKADYIILDPPKWISSRADEESGRRKYLDLNALAIAALPPGGLLGTASCSGRLTAGDFLEIVHRAAARAGRTIRILSVRGAPPDHPVSSDFPEGSYLNAVFATIA
ncbi:MAG: class I SAM-dependent rRNA methyltransferase [Planctomycetota bacterium]